MQVPFAQRELLSQGAVVQSDAAVLVPSAVQTETFRAGGAVEVVAQTSPTSPHCLLPTPSCAVAHSFCAASQMIVPLVVPAQSNWLVQTSVN